MINGNNQVDIRLAKTKTGVQEQKTLESLLYSKIVVPADNTVTITVPLDGTSMSPNDLGIGDILFVDGSSNVDGILDGATIAKALTVGYVGTDIINTIGNVHANVMPLMDKDHNEILKDNGDGIYVAVTSTYADGTVLTGSELKLNFFSYDSTGAVVLETLTSGSVYTIALNKVYAWANARAKELDTSKAIGSPLNETSREEVVKLMASLAKVKSDIYLNVTMNADSASVTEDTYTLDLTPSATKITVGLDVFGTASTIINTTVVNTVNGIDGYNRLVSYLTTFNTESPGINVYFNGVKIPTDLITVSATKISINNTKNKIGTGKIYSGDVFTIEFQDEI